MVRDRSSQSLLLERPPSAPAEEPGRAPDRAAGRRPAEDGARRAREAARAAARAGEAEAWLEPPREQIAIPWDTVLELRECWFGRAQRAGLAREDAEDLFQDALLAALGGLARLRVENGRSPEQAFLAWFWGILRHKMISELRRRRRVAERLSERESELRGSNGNGPLTTRVRCSLSVFARSSPRAAHILRRRFLEGRELRELAEELGVSVPTAWRRVQSALEEFRGCAELVLS
ncbi:MAG: sigma-70 family RNA polymerase sigma factor [Candidatus Eisenbacteria bacterium]|nr:sigma-70 family RNA polymerase sigma factor [Candidatus Eisenbacteria bacterium]